MNNAEQPKNIDTQDNIQEDLGKLDPKKLEDRLKTIDDDINIIKAQNDFILGKGYEVIPDTFQDFVDLLIRVETRNPDLLTLMNDYLKTTGTKAQLTNRDFLAMQEQGNSYIQKQGQTIDVGKAFNAVKQASMEHYQLLINDKSIAGDRTALPQFTTLDDARLIYRIMKEYTSDGFSNRVEAYTNTHNPNIIKPLKYLKSFDQFKRELIDENHLYLQNKNLVPKERFALYNTISTLIGKDLVFDKNIDKNHQQSLKDSIRISPESNHIVLSHLSRDNISNEVADYLTATIGSTYPFLSPYRQGDKFSLILDFKKVFESIKSEQTNTYMDRIQGSSIGSLDTISQELGLQQLPPTQQYLLTHALNPEGIKDGEVLQAQQKINGNLLKEYVRVQQETGEKFQVSTIPSLGGSREYTKEDIQAWEESDGLGNNADKLYKDIQTNIKRGRLMEFSPVEGKPETYTLETYSTGYSKDKNILIRTNFMNKRKGELPNQTTQ